MSRRHCKRHQAELFSTKYVLEREHLEGELHKVRNRMERRARIHSMPREFRIHVHGMGQWSKKIIKNGELTRP